MAKLEAKLQAGRTAALIDASVFNPLPIGARDLLPSEARRRRMLTGSLLASFERWGYREVVPPLLEYDEVLGRGLGSDERERCVRFIEAGTGKLVALRSDVTPQIARMVAQRVGGSVMADDAMRLCYAATLVRLPSGRHDRAELHQVGIEYVGDPEPTADAELIGLADAALVELGLRDHRFDLSHTGVVRDALARLLAGRGDAPSIEHEVLDHLARKDRDGLAQLLDELGIDPATARAFTSLAELHGPPQLLRDAAGIVEQLGAGSALLRLTEVVAAVEREYPDTYARLLVDLGEVRGFDYYTGVRLRVWAPGVGGPVVRGGRYDDLVGRYGAGLPATGLALDLDALDQALCAGEVGQLGNLGIAGAPPAWMVATCARSVGRELDAELRAAAVSEAGAARDQGLRSWIEREPDLEHAQRLAERRGAERLTWIDTEPGQQAGPAAALVVRRWHWSGGWDGGWREEPRATTSNRSPS
jgi:ATP phosphoribosyltransferase regulatory subunit